MSKLPSNPVDKFLVLLFALLVVIAMALFCFILMWGVYNNFAAEQSSISATIIETSAPDVAKIDNIEDGTEIPNVETEPTTPSASTPIAISNVPDGNEWLLATEPLNKEIHVESESFNATEFLIEQRYYYINIEGNVVFEPTGVLMAGRFSEGLAPAKTKIGWGYINTQGDFVIEPQFEAANPFENGFAAVRVGESDSGAWTYVDKTGKMIAVPQFHQAFPFSEGLAAVSIGEYPNRKWGYIDENGQYVINPKFFEAYSFHNGLAVAGMDNKALGFIDKSGTFVVNPQFSGVDILGGHIGFSGHIAFSDESLAAVSIGEYPNKQWGYVDKSGVFVIPAQFEEAKSFTEGLAAVKKNGKWGYINTKGETVIEAQFDNAQIFSEEVAAVAIGEDSTTANWGFIDKTGKFVINPRFQGIVIPFDRKASEIVRISTDVVDGKMEMQFTGMFINHAGDIIWETSYKMIAEQ